MAFDAFTRALGTQQGRIAPVLAAPVQGSYVVCLGNDLAGRTATLNVGDHVELTQVADFGATKVLRVNAMLRPPKTIPVGAAWIFSVRIDGVVLVARTIEAGRPRALHDLAASVAHLAPGNHTLAFRLELAAA